MRQLINIGNVVDDGTGDYLRKGGQKTNQNFDELYTGLGDGNIPHPAGAWKTKTDGIIDAIFGESLVLNTTNNPITVNLPKGNTNDYNKVIKIRDIFRTWSSNSVKLVPANGDTIKGSSSSVEIDVDYADIELVYCSPGRWEYVENKQINKISSSDTATVLSKSFIATDGQTDFPDVFNGKHYNKDSIFVYQRGNLLSYDPNSLENSEFGSIGANGELVSCDGVSIKLKYPSVENDSVTVVTYLDGLTTWRSSYESFTVRVFDSALTDKVSEVGVRWVGDLSGKHEFTLIEMGANKQTKPNPRSIEVSVNGIQLVEAGKNDYPKFSCVGIDADNEQECVINGGEWKETHKDYSLVITDNIVTGIIFGNTFEHGDVIKIKWFNNDIGTLLEWDGADGIKEKTSRLYLNVEEPLTINASYYTDYSSPKTSTMEKEPTFEGNISTLRQFFDIIYPIGTIYENAHNPDNPKEYMGMGVWIPYARETTLVGHSLNMTDPDFALNDMDLDLNKNPTYCAGGIGGSRSINIQKNNIPSLESSDQVLVKDKNGSIIIGGCQVDPDSEGPGYDKYREDTITVNDNVTDPISIKTLMPYTTVYRWLRVN